MESIRVIDIEENRKALLISLEDFDNNLKERIDLSLCEICEGHGSDGLSRVKSRLIRFLETKSVETSYGAVAELFLHIYIRNMGMKQECMLFNLEENSIKKGFDGLYSKLGEIYLMESKSTLPSTRPADHRSNLKLANSDLSSYIEGSSKKGRNNPWRNAYNHASHIDVSSSKPLREKLRAIADSYDEKKYKDASSFNLIPCSTIYCRSTESDGINSKFIIDSGYIMEFKALSLMAVCVTNSTYDAFMDYLKDGCV